MTAGATGASRVLPPSDTVDTPTELLLGGVPVHLFPSGNSHSPGDLLAWLPEQRVLFSGDVVYSDRMPSTNAGDIEQWIGFLDELVQLQPVAVVPGHGALTDVRGVQRLQALLRDLWQAVVDGYDAGLSDYEMVPGVIDALAAYRPFYPGLEDKLPRDISNLFLQVEAAAFR